MVQVSLTVGESTTDVELPSGSINSDGYWVVTNGLFKGTTVSNWDVGVSTDSSITIGCLALLVTTDIAILVSE